MTSPLAAIRSAPTRTAATSPSATQAGAAASVTMAYGTPAWLSSQAAIRDPTNPGRVSATRTWTGRPAWCATVITLSAVPNWPPPIAPVVPATRTWSGSSGAPGSAPRPSVTSAPWSLDASCTIASASSRRASATASPSASDPACSRRASIRSRAAAIAADPGRVVRSALAAPRIVARRANGRDVLDRPATTASITAATCAWAGDPLSAPSLIAPTTSAAPRSSSSTRTSGRRRWSMTRHTPSSGSQRNGAR